MICRCFNCFNEFDSSLGMCPTCGADMFEPNDTMQLKVYSELKNKYVIGPAINAGGFGIIYSALDKDTNSFVAIKEFFMSKIATRATNSNEVRESQNPKSRNEYRFRRERFLAEARAMAKFRDSANIPHVYDHFEENNTAYIVMELMEGQSLRDRLEEDPTTDLDYAVRVINEVGAALSALHEKDIVHRDVAPDNIFICVDGSIKLIDLGAAKLSEGKKDVLSDRPEQKDVVLKAGYAPVEQYAPDGKIGPWTDVYALGVTMYRMLTGIKPDEATDRRENDTMRPAHDINPAIPQNISDAIMKAVEIDVEDRFKSVKDFLNAINGQTKVHKVKKKKKQKAKGTLETILAIGAMVILALVASVLLITGNKMAPLPVTVSVWYAEENNSGERDALKTIVSDFMTDYGKVTVELKAIPKDEYATAIKKAAASGDMPTIYESTDLPDEYLTNAASLEKILKSDVAAKCEFLDFYNDYYNDTVRLPLGFEVPMAYIINAGEVYDSYSELTFTGLNVFSGTNIAIDSTKKEFLEKALGTKLDFSTYESEADFINERRSCAVLISSSMRMNEMRERLAAFDSTFSFFEASKIYCNYTYEWSMNKCSAYERYAASLLLERMLGDTSQYRLMVSMCNDGQLPVNSVAFTAKMDTSNVLAELKDICGKFCFER